MIVSRMKSIAEKRVNRKITKAVVTVPIYFNDSQKQATKDAAIIAGFKDVTILSEPEAAAVAICNQYAKNFKGNVFIYNFSKFYFDATVVTINKGVCEVKATKGDCSLGGENINKRLETFLIEDCRLRYGKQILNDDLIQRRLKRTCQRVKIRLSSEYTAPIELMELSDCDYTTLLTRLFLEGLSADIFDRTLAIVNDCLQDSAFKRTDINEVVLVGGSSKMPKVKQILQEYFGEDKIKSTIDSQEIVVCGAAIHARSLVDTTDKEEVIEVISGSLGINVHGDQMRVIFPRHKQIPIQSTKQYQTVKDDQVSIIFHIYLGEDKIASRNHKLGSFAIKNLTKAPAREVKVKISYKITAEGILYVSATQINNSRNSPKIAIDLRKRGFIIANTEIQQEKQETQHSKLLRVPKQYS
ncbi:hypothetical protein ILUMI_12131 [Ignelater luminosus]|uniref:Uncharacterized protein n=1 Tax=Ignelater luminosus TaxID=2038154 RepID=A0A8K0GC35_IGNLU|nr:hypothetical protein ILUMI_12131 [Ignelater luminosus]